ncbi:MAG TPA: penicillin-binding protein 2 [Candidatus Limnocylindria bacterium]|nr:penicillin-binding protein 2 [Candidatus Limnocylindria bacterium]
MTDIVLGKSPPPRSRLVLRFGVFGLIVVLIVGVLATRLFQLQVAQGGVYASLTRANIVAHQPLRSTRGLIFDRAGRPVVTNIPSYIVSVRPADLPTSRRDEVVDRLAALLAMPRSQVLEIIDRNAGLLFEPVRIAADVPLEVARIIAEEGRSLPGVEVSVEERRTYEYGPLLSHILGYTGPVSGEELEELLEDGYLNDDYIGRTGIEATFEQELRGSYGVEQVELDGAGRLVRRVQVVQPPQTGNSLELTIDVAAQRHAEEALRWATEIVNLKRGVVIAMNPQTGEILAMVSMPTYDNNLFARGISAEDYRALLEDANRPLVNFAISEQYPPGSTYKLVTGTGALEEGIINRNSRVETSSRIMLGSTPFWEWNRRGWGPLDIYDGFGHSSDTFFYQMAGSLGIDRLAHWAREFGFGERTGIDLPAEARGIVPTDQWKRDLFNEPIYPGEVLQAGIGQGYDTATPLQVLNAYAALANDGRLLKPQLVRRVLGADGSVVRDFEPELIRELDVDKDNLRTMREAARRVVTIRHTYNLVNLPIVVAGKTGTAEFGIRDDQGRLPFHSWFVAFVPKFEGDQPGDPAQPDSELAVIAFAYDSNTKGNAATEMVKYFLQLHYDLDVDLRRPGLLQRGNFYGGN